MSTLILIAEAVTAWAALSVFLLYSTWVHFAAVMRMRALRDSGGIDKDKDRMLWVCGNIMLAIGLALDVLLNVVVGTVVMLELPREWLTTTRLSRWNRSRGTSWWTRNVRKPMVNLGKVLLDKVDTDGVHIQ
jgi:hypothetical protein